VFALSGTARRIVLVGGYTLLIAILLKYKAGFHDFLAILFAPLTIYVLAMFALETFAPVIVLLILIGPIYWIVQKVKS